MDRPDPLETLLGLTRLLSTERSLEEALAATTDAAMLLLPCDHASLRTFDDERRFLLSSARSGLGQGHRPASFRRGEGVVGIVADTGRPALVADARTDARFVARPDAGFEVRSLIAVPLFAGGNVVGVLSVSHAAPDVFGARDRDLAQLLANCTAPAIETARLARLAVTDELTRAFNYRYHHLRLAEEVGRARRYGDAFSVLMMDLDHFKDVNDRHGHQIGDEVLRGFVERLREEVREPDVVIRRGGEEFVLLMPSTDAGDAAQVAERIRAHVAAAPIATSGGGVPLTVSIGVATWRADESGGALEGRADEALYRAKAAGRDRVEVADPA
ncbi:MAG: sensor domain-containing diguanylate cyclase [Sandaracinaceae bacterium]|nr:sensor domain-containing diguanylate cyclase [Sandaracinaceae bacterium]